ncbi:MAG: SpoIID/LytB domain-containing protein [Gemmatimonadota bacterium]
MRSARFFARVAEGLHLTPVPRRIAAFAIIAAAGCSAAAASRKPATPNAPGASDKRSASARIVRIGLADAVASVRVSSAGPWVIFAEDGRTPVALTQPGEKWLIEREGLAVRAQREDSRPVSAREGTVVVHPLDADGQIGFNGRRYRGDLVISATAAGLVVVNRLPMDDYLRGVVPLEIGSTSSRDVAAVEAQAVTARSYAVTHINSRARYDMRATVSDQVYGGAGVETNASNLAVQSTSGLVLLYGGQVVNAPYYSTCGGSTAEPQDVWRTGPEPYLRRVSDQIPGTTRFYCDFAPRYRWTRTFGRDDLRQHVVKYMKSLGGNASTISSVRSVTVTDVTPAGRVSVLTIETDRGAITLRGNEMRSALRLASGELLYSTYFSVETVMGRDGVETLTLIGGGNGHGVGMCQAGAIGRARAGQDFRTILRTYYPGTTVGTID